MDGQLNNQGDNTIDFMKFVFALFVVGIHMGIFGRVDLFSTWFLSHWLFRPAVPFFFVVSGYYFGMKLWNASPGDIKYVFRDYRIRLLPALVVWGGIALVIQTLHLYREGTGIATIILKDIRTIIFYPQGAMWFLWACIIASYIIQVFFRGTKHIVLLGVISVIGYAFALICSTYYFGLDGTRIENIIDQYLYYCISARNGLFVGALFILEGILISLDKVQQMVKKIAGWKLWFALTISEMIFVCEICYTYGKTNLEDNSLFIIFPVLIPIIVLVALRYRMKIKLPYVKLRKMSTSIYFMHYSILYIARIYISSNYILFGIVLIIPIGMSLIAQKVDKPLLNKLIL